MERREPPRTTSEHQESPSAARTSTPALEPPRLSLRRPNRFPLDRAGAGIAITAIIGIAFGLYVAYRAKCALVAWLADQPAYQLEFRSIVLDPPPPSWYRGGAARYLDEVRRLSGMPESIALLKLKDEELKHAFEQNPWTEEVLKISYRPLGVGVRLVYHRPVALVEVSAREKYLVDESAIILPREDLVVDLDEFARRELLLTINGVGLASPQDPKPGLAWKARAGTTEIAPGNGRIADAARLARFLVEKLRDVDRASHPALKFLYINPMDQHKKYRGLFLWNPDEKISVLWGDAPGTEDPGIMSAEEKWRKIYDWSRNTSQPTLPDGRYWEITDSGLIEAGIERYPPQSARSVPPPLDARTILTKVPGQSP